jgi:cell division GTPase FtsZ
VNVDFGDVKTVMEGKGVVLMGIGRGTGENRAVDAATTAIQNPLLEDVSIDGAQGVLVSIKASPDFSMTELNEIMGIVTANSHEDAIIKFGYSINESFRDEIFVTVVAAGFPGTEADEGRQAPRTDDLGTKNFGGLRTPPAYGTPKAVETPRSRTEETADLFSGSYRTEPLTRPAKLPVRSSGFPNRSDDPNLDIPTILRQGYSLGQGN